MLGFSIEIRGLDVAERMLLSISGRQLQSWQQQAINREGRLEIGRSAKEIQAAIPIKLKYIRKRIVWRNADKNGTAGRLRFYGSGKGDSAWLRPRNMRPTYPTSDTRINLGRGKNTKVRVNTAAQRRRAALVQYGVGGSMPEAARRTVLRGFVSSVGEGRVFTHSYQAGFKRERAQVFQRIRGARLPIKNNRGVTIGVVAARLGMFGRVADRIGERASIALQARIERELKARAAKAAVRA